MLSVFIFLFGIFLTFNSGCFSYQCFIFVRKIPIFARKFQDFNRKKTTLGRKIAIFSTIINLFAQILFLTEKFQFQAKKVHKIFIIFLSKNYIFLLEKNFDFDRKMTILHKKYQFFSTITSSIIMGRSKPELL